MYIVFITIVCSHSFENRERYLQLLSAPIAFRSRMVHLFVDIFISRCIHFRKSRYMKEKATQERRNTILVEFVAYFYESRDRPLKRVLYFAACFTLYWDMTHSNFMVVNVETGPRLPHYALLPIVKSIGRLGRKAVYVKLGARARVCVCV
jgi:hypothetical protein